jgi:hypothetical protein
MAEKKKGIFATLSAINTADKVKEKNGLKYLPWSQAVQLVKDVYPNTTFEIIPQIVDEKGNTRPWHDDGKTGWVEVSVRIEADDGEVAETREMLAIMDFRNKAIPSDDITSVDANKSIKRCLVKALAIATGLSLYIYSGEELPDELANIIKLQNECMTLIKKKCELSEKAKEKVGELCKAADVDANGDPRLINDIDTLTTLKKQLMAVRK